MVPTTNAENYFICPVNYKYLTKAVALVPCQHKINESAAKIIFNNTNDNSSTTHHNTQTSGKACPVCRGNVVAYNPDHAFRSLAELAKKGF